MLQSDSPFIVPLNCALFVSPKSPALDDRLLTKIIELLSFVHMEPDGKEIFEQLFKYLNRRASRPGRQQVHATC